MRLTGTWIGEYVYGAGYEESGVAQKSVPFTLSLTESWLRRIAGYVQDNASRGGQPERGRIHGTRRDAEVEFVKTMPNHHVTVDGVLVELQDYYAEHGVELPDKLPPHRILYRGTLDQHGESISGTWKIASPRRVRSSKCS